MSSLTRIGYSIPLEDCTNEHFYKLKVKPKLMNDFQWQNISFNVYRRSKTRIYMPKFYGYQYFGKPKENKERIGDDINISFVGNLTDEQIPISHKTIIKCKDSGGGILCLPTGFGKTVLALHILSKLNKKTLIIVHKEFLLNQWVERINTFLPDAKIGKIQRNIIDIENKDIVLGMLQSISLKDYDLDIFDCFGTVITDETHHLCAKNFSKAFFKISTKYMIGLSATPDRKDGLTKVIEWFMGPIFIRLDSKLVKPNIRFVRFIQNDFEERFTKQGKLNIMAMISDLSIIKKRTELIIDEIIKAINENRNILVLSALRQHCMDIYNLIPSHITKGLYIGSMKTEELKESMLARVIIGTYAMCEEGFDCPKLDTLIMATPKREIEQSVGRILRLTGSTLRNCKPLVIDIVDPYSAFNGQYYSRRKFYKYNEYKIEGEIKKIKGKIKGKCLI